MVAKKTVKEKSLSATKNNNSSDMDLLLQYCHDINRWADSWKFDEPDVKIGKAIVEEFKKFLIYKIKQGRAKSTINTHQRYLWALGGELISQLNYDETERALSARELILEYVDYSGGPYWRHAYDEADHDKFDSVCRQLFKFMTTYSD